jgi:hypothetical protein
MLRMLAAVVLAIVCATQAAGVAATAPPRVENVSRKHDPCASKPSAWQRKQCESFTLSAPGDEYFGPLKISYLGIDNTAHDVTIQAGAYTTDSGLISRLHFADLALRDWERKYPGDPQLARSYYLIIVALRKVYTPAAQQEAFAYMQHVIRAFPKSYFAKSLKASLARGFTEHWFSLPEFCPTPLPTPEPGKHRVALATPSPTPSPEPTETPTPARGQPKVEILTPPCVQPPTPTPSATPTPIPTATPVATPVPPTTPPTTPAPTGVPALPSPTATP